MPSKAEQICARMTALLALNTDAGAAVYRDRSDAFTRDESPALLVEIVDEDSEPHGGAVGPFVPLNAIDRDTLRVAVTVAVRAGNWQQIADAVRVQAHALIARDPQLSQIAPPRRDRCEWRPASADLPFGYVSQIYRFTYPSRAYALDASS